MRASRLFALFVGASADSGLTYLQNNAKIFYDFTQLSGSDGSAITSVTDLGPAGVNASNTSPAASPVLMYSQWGKDMIRTFKAWSNSGTSSRDVLIANTFGETEFKTDFEVLWVGALPDSGVRDLFGVTTGTNVFRVNIISNTIRVEYRYSAATARRFVAATPTISTVIGGMRLYRAKLDFTNDVFKFWIDGVEQSMTSLVDAFNLLDPTKWANTTNKLCIGGHNVDGVITLYANYHLMKAFAVTPILSNQQVIDVSNYLVNTSEVV